MKARLLLADRNELWQAVRYYDEARPGRGADFLAQVESAVERITNHPNAWHPLSERTRRCLVRRFPYGIIYQVRDDEILIVAVANLHRKPEYWKRRLGPN